MVTITGEPTWSAQAHETLSKILAERAVEHAREAARCEGAALGLRFRANEIREDARERMRRSVVFVDDVDGTGRGDVVRDLISHRIGGPSSPTVVAAGLRMDKGGRRGPR